ncbi:MAG: hypothetical protein ACI9PZ_000411 [Parvicella sp.]|jgi:hypothetical protein
MPNQFAYLALLAWPIIVFAMMYYYCPLKGSFWAIACATLLLPAALSIDFPLIPALDRLSITVFSILIFMLLFKRRRMNFLPQRGAERWFFIGATFAPILTIYGNSEALELYNRVAPGYGVYDAISESVKEYLGLVPFLLGMTFVKTSADQHRIFSWLVLAALIYSLPILFEIRMSPQLHQLVYGFFPSSFHQQIRYGGFRPVVLMGHGLPLAFFLCICICAATSMQKSRVRFYGFNPLILILYLIVVLTLSKSLSPLLFALSFIILLLFLRTSMFHLTIQTIAFAALLYPFISMMTFEVQDALVAFFSDIDINRAQSLAYRFDNEELLLSHAMQKWLFGWGSWGRNQIGGAVFDSTWIIVFGQFGLFGLISFFGIIYVSLVKALASVRRILDPREIFLMYSHILIVLVILIDQLVNSSINSSGLYWFLAGGLLGRAKHLALEKHTQFIGNASKKPQVVGPR